MKLVACALLAACGPARAPVDKPEPHDVPSACPLAVFPDQAWAHELFPGCPEMPFTSERLPVCSGACPHPCRAITGARVFAIRYDGQGRWVGLQLESSTDTSDLLSIGCTYDGDHFSACTRKYLGNIEWTDRFERDAAGRLAHVVNDQERIDIERDASGRPTALVTIRAGVAPARTELAYDHRGRIVREQANTHVVNDSYDGDRWVERRDDVSLTTLAYDHDRVASVVTRGHTGNRSEVHVAYDAHGVRTVTRGDDVTTYQYDCH